MNLNRYLDPNVLITPTVAEAIADWPANRPDWDQAMDTLIKAQTAVIQLWHDDRRAAIERATQRAVTLIQHANLPEWMQGDERVVF